MRSSLFAAPRVAALAGLVAGVALVGTVHAQQPVTLPLTVTENRAPGGGGQVTMTPLGNNQVRVDIRTTGLPANEQRAVHIHTAQGARCDTGAPVTYPLSNVAVDGSGNGASTTTITLAADRPVQAGNAYVNIHQNNIASGGEPGQGVLCANVTATFQAGAAATGAPAPAPGTGGQAPAAGGLPGTGVGDLTGSSTTTSGIAAALAAVVATLAGAGTLVLARQRVAVKTRK